MDEYIPLTPAIARRIAEYALRFPQVHNISVEPSQAKGKRLVAEFTMDGRRHRVHFGQAGAFTFADGAPEEKRRLYRLRASKIKNAAGEYTYLLPGTANSLAYHILW